MTDVKIDHEAAKRLAKSHARWRGDHGDRDVCKLARAYLAHAAKIEALESELVALRKAAEAFEQSFAKHYHGYPSKMEWPEIHVLKQALTATRTGGGDE